MYSANTSWSVFLFTVNLFVLPLLARASGIGIFQTYEVYIFNNFDNNANELIVHCKSADDDLGDHFLDQDGNWHWKFRVNFFRSTLFFCHVQWGGMETSFTVFDTDYISYKCEDTSTCFWSVRNDGIYFSCDNENYVKRYIWP
ncbi:hypothetical protein PHJA_001763400 [Phtheirospermum japonicum]|uniref:S-protein homolog n=1 Tax=Phtheirospermum japonicum TaxID=374723 RepID=A0A830CK70_9LAMI|nr:hypothetical protein PHJA_001763400 [Phtheirospermum japonicum]